MMPFLRPTNLAHSAPTGWVAEPAGLWGGKEVDVIFDPVRHDVAFVRHDIGDDVRDKFRGVGYERLAVDGPNEMWVRDRRSALQAAWNRVDRPSDRALGVDSGGRGL